MSGKVTSDEMKVVITESAEEVLQKEVTSFGTGRKSGASRNTSAKPCTSWCVRNGFSSDSLEVREEAPYRKISDLLRWKYNLDISPSMVLDLTGRAVDWLNANNEEILQEARSADVAYVDERSIKVNGRKG